MNPIVYAFILVFGVAFLILPVAVPVFKSSADMSIFNTNWNGLSGFAKLVSEKREVVPIFYPYNNAKIGELKGVLLIISPGIEFSLLEAEEVKKFLENGGTVFIADDSGTANTLLEKLGIKARFSKERLKDIFYSKNEKFPVVLKTEGELNFRNLTLNAPSAILGVRGEILTSKASILKDMGEYTVFAELKYGNGKIILFSDPSALMNEMLNENREFAINLIEVLGDGTFYFDEAHRPDLNLYHTGTIYIHRELEKSSAFALILITAIFAIAVESGLMNKFPRIKFGKKKTAINDLPEWVDREKLKEMLERMGIEYGEIDKRSR
ncbi:MAG: DUF4350 domain-containing protein [Archaeoglobaceae archaeon]